MQLNLPQDKLFNNKINILKAIAIMLVLSGHLEFSLIPFFPPYSFHMALFFFISGYLFKKSYLDNLIIFFKKRVKSLILPYYLYNTFYLLITILIAKFSGKFWGLEVSLKNFFLTPFLNGHQFDLSCPLWFVPQLFISLCSFAILCCCFKKFNKNFTLILYLLIAILGIFLSFKTKSPILLICIRTMFSMFFIYLGFYYKEFIEGRLNIFNVKIFLLIVAFQSFLWLFNKDFTPYDGIGLSYILVWGEFDGLLVPILTSLTGIYASMFIAEIFYNYLKDNRFLHLVGKNTFHIMANHLLVYYFITVILLKINGLPLSLKNDKDIYWFYDPIKTTYFYFTITLVVTTYFGAFQQFVWKKVKQLWAKNFFFDKIK